MMSYRIRRAQLISPFGVGSMQVFEDGNSLMVGGLDAWSPSSEYLDRIQDKRLEMRLGVKSLRLPPEKHIPLFRFPEWHFCYRCRMMTRIPLTKISQPFCNSTKSPACCADRPESKRKTLQQMRFIVACPAGHVEDFPWLEWLGAKKHGGNVRRNVTCCDKPLLRFITARRTGLVDIIVQCMNCGTRRSLAGSNARGVFDEFECIGYQPWLGGNTEPCDKNMQLVQRGASNTYFPDTRSSILIPPFSGKIARSIERNPILKDLIESSAGTAIDQIANVIADNIGESSACIKDYIKLRNQEPDEPISEKAFRMSEYKALISQSGRHDDLFITNPQNTNDYPQFVRDYLSNIVLAEKITETRAMVGFTRIQPPYVNETKPSKLSLHRKNWLPASRVYGEGIFLTLDPKRLSVWEKQKSVQARVSNIRDKYLTTDWGRRIEPIQVTPSFVLLHSLAHLLIRQLIFECGYGSASLRERLYCGDITNKNMNGILIYTTSGDSEGSMGGLVAQGNKSKLPDTLRTALLNAVFCSSDPICRESNGQGSGALNLAACHACMLLPETSCEMGNIMLDRLLLVGSPEDPRLGYWGEQVSDWLTGELP